MNKQIPQSLHTTAKTLGRKQGNLRATGFSDGFLDTTLKTRSKRERGRSGPRRTLTLSRIAGHCPGGGGTARAGGGRTSPAPGCRKTRDSRTERQTTDAAHEQRFGTHVTSKTDRRRGSTSTLVREMQLEHQRQRVAPTGLNAKQTRDGCGRRRRTGSLRQAGGSGVPWTAPHAGGRGGADWASGQMGGFEHFSSERAGTTGVPALSGSP